MPGIDSLMFGAALGLNARPSILIMDGDEELVRIAGVLRRFHFQTALRYVAEEEYHEYLTVREYTDAYRGRLIIGGQDVDVGVQ